MFRIEMLPAREGDCLIVTYGTETSPHRVLIDGGRKATHDDLVAHVSSLPQAQREFELLIVSHVDRDHIEGILALVENDDPPLSFKDVWFNGYHHLFDEDFEEFGAAQGERLTEQILKRVHANECTWNASFGEKFQKAAALPKDGSLLEVELAGGLRLTLLSPTRQKLVDLQSRWLTECTNAGMIAGEAAREPPPEGFEFFSGLDIDELADQTFKEDKSEPNGSSIAVLAEYDGKRALLAGDAFPSVLVESLKQLSPDGPLHLDALKIPHHGSRKNISKDLLAAIACKRYLISTNGSYFDHPDPVAMSRLAKYGGTDKQFWFNYRSEEALLWATPPWPDEWSYSAHYPDEDRDGYQLVQLD